MLTGNNGILTRAGDAKEQTIIGQEKESVELAYITAAMKKLGDDVTANDLQDELDAMLGDTGETDATKKKTNVKQNSNNTINVLFRATQHNYNVNQGKVAKVLEDGIYVGNVRMGGLYLPDVNNMSYEDYKSSISNEKEIVDVFFQKCQETETKPSNSEYKDALESAEKVGISREWIDYAYNNQGDSIECIKVSSYNIDRLDEAFWEISIPFTGKIISVDKNFGFDLNTYTDIGYSVVLERDPETGETRALYEKYPMDSEVISCGYNDPNQAIPDEVQLPFGMVLKYVEDPYTAEYFINNWGYTREEATQEANHYNEGVYNDCVIEWQGQTFNVFELRDYIHNNIKIVYNGQTVNLTSSTSGGELDDLFGIEPSGLYEWIS